MTCFAVRSASLDLKWKIVRIFTANAIHWLSSAYIHECKRYWAWELYKNSHPSLELIMSAITPLTSTRTAYFWLVVSPEFKRIINTLLKKYIMYNAKKYLNSTQPSLLIMTGIVMKKQTIFRIHCKDWMQRGISVEDFIRINQVAM